MFFILLPIIFATYLFIRMLISDNKENREKLGSAIWLGFTTSVLSIICQFAASHSVGQANTALVRAVNAGETGKIDRNVIPRYNVSVSEAAINIAINLLWSYYMYCVVKRYASLASE